MTKATKIQRYTCGHFQAEPDEHGALVAVSDLLAAVAAAREEEREACASIPCPKTPWMDAWKPRWAEHFRKGWSDYAAAIRARGE